MGKLFKRDRSPFYWMDYQDHTGKRIRKSSGCRDKTNAAKVLAKVESDSALVEHGVKSKVADMSKEPLDRHLDDYETALKTIRTAKYAAETKRQIARVADFAGWHTLGDIDAQGLEDWIVSLHDSGRGARTVGAYVTALRMFANWCIERRPQRMLINPVSAVKKPSVQNNRKYTRRMLLQNEWKWLSESLTKCDAVRNGMDASERRMLYWLAIETGLRAKELHSLTKSDLKIHAKEPHVICKAGSTKNKKLAQQFISDDLAKALSGHVARKLPTAEVFGIRSLCRLAMTITADLDAARLYWMESRDKLDSEKGNPYFLARMNADGESFDFHSLRHTTGAWLVLSGVSLKEVQVVMRHSTIMLTADTYGHIAPDAKSRNRHVLGAMLA